MTRTLRLPLVWLARLVVAGAFRGFEVTGRDRRGHGPRLIVANHFGGLVDPIVAVAALGGMPNIVAKSTLFNRLPLRLLLRALGVIPIYRSMDVVDTSGNRSSFAAVHEALAHSRSVLIFPEGTVTDAQRLLPLRTGAARMVLGAMAEGTQGISILPVGITYEDKVSSRSRVLVEFGEPIDADSVIPGLLADGPVSEDNHDAVHNLTDEITVRLRSVSPDFGSLVREAEMMELADFYLRTGWDDPFRDPPVSDLRSVAQRLAHVPEDDAAEAVNAAGRYTLAVQSSGLSDDAITPRPSLGDVTKLIIRRAVVLLLLSPIILFGLAANIVPILLVTAIGTAIVEPVTKGTARVIGAIVLFPLSWAVLIWLSQVRGWGIALEMLLLAIASVVVVSSIQLVVELVESVLWWRQVRGRRALLDDLARRREPAEVAIAELLGVEPQSPVGGPE